MVGEPSRCNRDGELVSWLQGQDRAATIVPIPGGGHGDIEGEPAAIYRWGCGDATPEATRAAVLTEVVASVLGGLTRDP